jgi:hypothetical protein
MKRLLAGTLAAMTAGATLAMGAFGIASLGDYVTTSDGSLASPIIVVGNGAGSTGAGIVKDVLGAADIAAAVAGHATTLSTVGASGASVTVSNGATLDTPNQKLYLGDTIDNATQTLTSNELPTLLASGSVTTNDGDFDYDQFIEVGNSTLEFSKSGEDIDPVVLINVGTSNADPVYRSKVVFSKALNLTDSDTSGETITLFGTEYTFSSDSTNTKMVLFGSGQTITLSEGDEQTVSVGGTSYTIRLLGVSQSGSTDVAIVQVNDVSDEVNEEATRKIGGLNIFAKDVFYLGKENQISSATLQLGSQKLTLENAKEVKVTIGSDDTTIDNTWVSIAGSADVSSLSVAVAAQDSDEDHVAVGTPLTDPVWGGFQIEYGGMVPADGSASIEAIELGIGGADDATVKFVDDRGNTKSLSFANSVSGTMSVADAGGDVIHIYEGATAIEKEYLVIDSGDFGHVYEVTEIDPATSTDTGEVSLKDAFSGATITKILPKNDNTVDWVIDGQTYKLNVSDETADEIELTWGAGASNGDIGSELTVFPTIETSKGGLLALVDDVNVTVLAGLGADEDRGLDAGDTIELPGAEEWTFSGNSSEASVMLNSSDFTPGKVKLRYNVTYNDGVGGALRLIIRVGNPDSTNTYDGIITPGVVIIEEEDDDDEKHAIVAKTKWDSANEDIEWVKPAFTNLAVDHSASLESDTKVTEGLDEYGTRFSFDTDPDQDVGTIYYPDFQRFTTVAIGTDPSFAVGEASMQTAVKLTSPVSKLASEVNANAPGADLILVGGPCANSVTAAVMGVATSYPECAAPFDGLTKGIVAEYTDAFTDGSKALVVAGVTADDTRSLAAGVMAGTFSVNQ